MPVPNMNSYVEEIYLHAFFIASLDGGEWSALPLGRFNFGNQTPVPV